MDMRTMRMVVMPLAVVLSAGSGTDIVGSNEDNAHWRRGRMGLRHGRFAVAPPLCYAEHAHDGDRCGDRKDAGRHSGAEEVAWHCDRPGAGARVYYGRRRKRRDRGV